MEQRHKEFDVFWKRVQTSEKNFWLVQQALQLLDFFNPLADVDHGRPKKVDQNGVVFFVHLDLVGQWRREAEEARADWAAPDTGLVDDATVRLCGAEK